MTHLSSHTKAHLINERQLLLGALRCQGAGENRGDALLNQLMQEIVPFVTEIQVLRQTQYDKQNLLLLL